MVAKELPLPTLAAVLEAAGLFIGNDSGVTHIAAAVGIPTVAIFGPTDPTVWAPRGKRVEAVCPQTPCAPCTREERTACERLRCLDEVEISSVLEAVERARAQ